MKYPEYNFILYQGVDEVIPFSFYTLLEDGTKKFTDFTGSKFLMTIRDNFQGDIVNEFTSDSGKIKIGKIIGDNEFSESSDKPHAIQIEFTHKDTFEYTMPNLVYDIFRVTENKQEVLLHGTITMMKGIISNESVYYY